MLEGSKRQVVVRMAKSVLENPFCDGVWEEPMYNRQKYALGYTNHQSASAFVEFGNASEEVTFTDATEERLWGGDFSTAIKKLEAEILEVEAMCTYLVQEITRYDDQVGHGEVLSPREKFGKDGFCKIFNRSIHPFSEPEEEDFGGKYVAIYYSSGNRPARQTGDPSLTLLISRIDIMRKYSFIGSMGKPHFNSSLVGLLTLYRQMIAAR